MNRLRHGAVCALGCLMSLAYCQTTQAIPETEATALSGRVVRLPQDLPTHAVLILGFSEKSSSDVAECEKRIRDALPNPVDAKVYQIPVLEGTPRLVRGFITRSMKKSVPAPLQSTFLPVFDHEAEWKRLTRFASPDDAYILLAGPVGRVLWRTHGPCSADKVTDVIAEFDKENR